MEKKINCNPWMKIWTAPRATIQEIVSLDPNFRFYVLSWFYGFSLLLHAAQNMSLADRIPLAGILVGSAVLAILFGMLSISIVSALLFWCGKLLGGQAPYRHLRAAVAWASVSNVVNALMWLILTGYFGPAIFSSAFIEIPMVGSSLYVSMAVSIVQLVVSIWSIVILIKSVAQVQKFSSWKALVNILIPMLLVFIATWLLTTMLNQ